MMRVCGYHGLALHGIKHQYFVRQVEARPARVPDGVDSRTILEKQIQV